MMLSTKEQKTMESKFSMQWQRNPNEIIRKYLADTVSRMDLVKYVSFKFHADLTC